MKPIFSVVLLLFCLNFFGQNQANNWYFGDGAGIQFNSDGSVTNLSNGKLATEEGCTTISDANGNLLFYTDGITVWNKNHQPMPNANGIGGLGLFGDPSSTQSAIIVPKPEDPNIYYIFTVDTSSFDGDIDTGFNYSTVDLRLDGGLGDIVSTEKNVNLLNDSSEKISAVLKDCASKSIWVITFAANNGVPNQFLDTFYAYEVSSTGIKTPPVKSTFNIQIADPRGYLKLSPDGTKLACANSESGLYLYDFDSATGKVTNQQELTIKFSPSIRPARTQFAYGVEFSQNNEFLYVSTFYSPATFDEFFDPSSQYGALLQYNLNNPDVNSSEVVIDHKQMYRGALQLGPNGKIYRAMNTTYNLGTPFLSVINSPNKEGTECDYKENAVSLTRNSRQGLPPFITSFFSEKINITKKESNFTYLPLCIGEDYTLTAKNIPGATYLWTIDGAAQTDNDFDFEVNGPGTYKVLIQSTTGNCGDVLEGEALVKYFASPIANPINNIKTCDDNNDGKYNFDFTEQTKESLGTQNPDIYNVKYFLSQEDADNNKNEISLPFENTKNPQKIFTRVGITENETCFDTSKYFLIEVLDTPKANDVLPATFCDYESLLDTDTTNGITQIDLHQFDKSILDNQDPTKFTITYYPKLIDANRRDNVLDYNFVNKTAFSTSIFARIENNLNTECYAISKPIDITINPLPSFSNTSLIQCDEDGLNDEKTIFNLLEAKEELTNSEIKRSIKFFKTFDNQTRTLSNEILNIEGYTNETNPQTLFVQVINDDTKCDNIARLSLEISTTTIMDYNAIPVCDELGSEDGFNTFDLNDITTDIHAINGITYPITYYESYEEALSETNPLPLKYNNKTRYEQIIFARAENDNACYGIGKVKLKINKLPNINSSDLTPTYYCLNKYPETISINSGLDKESISDYYYNWSNGKSTYSIDVNKTGIYTVEVTNKTTLCSKIRTINIEASDIATFDTIPYSVEDASTNNSITIFASGAGTYQYALYDENNLTIYKDYQNSGTFNNVYPGAYTIRVNDIKNDCGYVPEKVFVIGFPKLFTPNNDGVNDTWQLYGIKNNMLQANSQILIFDRYGKLVKQLSPEGNGWNGLFNGLKLPSDDYWFAVTLQDGRIFKSHFTLKY